MRGSVFSSLTHRCLYKAHGFNTVAGVRLPHFDGMVVAACGQY